MSVNLVEKVELFFFLLLLFFSSEASGNCLFSSISILLVGDNSLSEDLRALSCLELFLYSSFYATHPDLNKIFSESQGEFLVILMLFLTIRCHLLITNIHMVHRYQRLCSSKLLKHVNLVHGLALCLS